MNSAARSSRRPRRIILKKSFRMVAGIIGDWKGGTTSKRDQFDRVRRNGEGHRHKSDQFAVDLGLHVFAGNVDSRGPEKGYIPGVLRDSAKRNAGKVP